MIGRRFGRGIVISLSHKIKKVKIWKMKCDCGNYYLARGENLKYKQTLSCKCLRKEIITKHGKSKSKIYGGWINMIQRCTNKNSTNYKHYGGRGIKVCEKWMNFENFLEDMGDRPQGCSLERIDNNGDYCKENCRWATQKEQLLNTRRNKYLEYKGKRQTLKEWSIECGIDSCTLRQRLKRQWNIEETLTKKVNIQYRQKVPSSNSPTG